MANKSNKAKTPNIPPSSAQPTAGKSQPASKKPSQRKRKQQSSMWLWIAAAVVVVGLVALIVVNNQSQAEVSAPPTASELPAELVSRNTKGAPDAKVVVTEFSDYECPACKTFSQSTLKRLDEEYVQTGKIRFEYKHYPLPQHDPSATWAANAAECAADQGKFWEMSDYLFQEQGKQGTNTFTQGRLRNMGEALGLDAGQFNDCLSRQTHAKVIRDHVNEARQLFVNATPTIFVNGVKVANPSYDAIKAAIDAALAQQG